MNVRSHTAVLAGGVGAVVVVALVAGTGVLTAAKSGPPQSTGLPPATATVKVGDVTETLDTTGKLAHGSPVDLAAHSAGTLTSLPAAGAKVVRGGALYSVDAKPVFLFYGTVPLYRPVHSGDTGADVAEVENNLSNLGYGGFTVDDKFTDKTAQAIKNWQKDAGVPVTGSIDAADFAVAAGPVQVSQLHHVLGDAIAPGQPVLSYTSGGRVVTASIDASDQQYAQVGASVTVELPDHSSTGGTIAAVTSAPPPSTSDGNSSSSANLTMTVSLQNADKVTGVDGAPVTVHVVTAHKDNVLTVPVIALLALSEGGYGVQVVDGASTKTVAVKTGLFSQDTVEISGAGVKAGMKVGVPST
ncbi:peptidoglycan-binding protein [Fodinicola feengrottensis]|uniref:Peptidoglycan-binding protein n=1 Tax=Fodinicola feengrottensis TaxID=435914 RepID=A0ABP4RLG0_9ACTN